MAEYKQMKAEVELLKMLAEAEDDVQTGRVSSMKDTFNDLRKSLLERK